MKAGKDYYLTPQELEIIFCGLDLIEINQPNLSKTVKDRIEELRIYLELKGHGYEETNC